MRLRFLLGEAWIGLRRNLTMTFAVVLVVALSVGLLGVALMVRNGVHRLQDALLGTINVSVYLEPNCSANVTTNCITQQELQQIDTTLHTLPEVSGVTYLTQEQAYELFKKQNANNPQLISVTPKDALPQSYVVKLASPTPENYAVVVSAVAKQPGVQSVSNGQAVIRRIFDVLNRLTHAIYVFVIGLFIVTLLLIWNMARVAVFSRRREIGIMRLVGAGDLSIQAPFIFEGFVMGLIGTAVGLLLILAAKEALINHIAISVFATFSQPGVLGAAILPVVLVGVLTTTIITGLTLQRHLRV